MKPVTSSRSVRKTHSAVAPGHPPATRPSPPPRGSARRDAAGPIPAAAAPAAVAALRPRPVRIGIFRPEAREVMIAGSFNGWDPREMPLKRDSFGDWSIELSLPPGEHRYRLLVDGLWTDDPSAQRMEANSLGGFDAVISV